MKNLRYCFSCQFPGLTGILDPWSLLVAFDELGKPDLLDANLLAAHCFSLCGATYMVITSAELLWN
jgi:hypothetical protein